MYYLNPNQMKPNCFTYFKSNTKLLNKKLFNKYFCFFLKKNISKSYFCKFNSNKNDHYAK